ncbi:long-chain acyl-CoA synthetase [Jatrophihabitans sp. GAS493]|uniref:AMP-dependent synthetase/ligase n=1 Tax=Jatrophihabitans sp. GAS493 TaxID=1907575 RepID=UPI000BB835B7|nr:long-chain fatty acid--CoA ligase [Jatrophihabitans sp. GAS493]SOD74380.1 long-chain acyl-CoA synthetase [Jatrophihabitans sp. GAS493]
MREIAVPSTNIEAPYSSTAQCVFNNARDYPTRVALRRRAESGWSDVTTTDFANQVTDVAKGLLNAGIDAGDRVALMSKTRYEWTVADFAVLAIGAVVVPIYETSSAEQIEWILADSGAKAVFVESQVHAGLVESVRSAAPDLAHVWLFDEDAFEALRVQGADVATEEIQKRLEATSLEDAASIIYTSGTTGRPKGCVLLHRSFIAEITDVTANLGDLFEIGSSTLLFLPIAHVFGRVIEIGAIANGTVLGHTADISNLLPDLASFKPTFILSVPRVFEKVFNTAKQRAHADGKGSIFDKATDVAIRHSEAVETGHVGLRLKLTHAVFDKLVYSKLRAALGGECRAAVSGGAPLGTRLGHFFRGVGVTIYEGYGLTETTAGIAVNRPGNIRIGTVGQPVPGVSARVADDGELLIHGTLVFDRYWRNEAATSEAIDADGWFHSGDIGEIDSEGYIKITGRKKEILVTAGGKNVAPAVLEDRVRAHWLVSQCLVVGDGQPYISALVTIDPEAFPTWLKDAGRSETTTLADVVDDPALRAEIQVAVDDANKAVSKAEAIRKFVVLPTDWTEATGELTPSLKLKRNVVEKQCSELISGLYSDVQKV